MNSLPIEPPARNLFGADKKLFGGPSPLGYNVIKSATEKKLDPDAILLRRIADRDADAFETLCEKYHKRLYAYLYRMLGQREPTEEALNATFFNIWRSAARFRGEAAASSWMISIARNQALGIMKKQKPETNDEPVQEKVDETAFCMEERLISKDLVRRGLARLSTVHREALELAFFWGLSLKEIAAIADVPHNTIKTRLFHARQQLRHIILAFGKRGRVSSDTP